MLGNDLFARLLMVALPVALGLAAHALRPAPVVVDAPDPVPLVAAAEPECAPSRLPDGRMELGNCAGGEDRLDAIHSSPYEPNGTVRQASVLCGPEGCTMLACKKTKPAVLLVDLIVVGRIRERSVREALQSAEPALLSCYREAAADSPNLHGFLDLEFAITFRGATESVHVTHDSMNQEGLAGCIERVGKSWAFLNAEGASALVRTSLVFRLVDERTGAPCLEPTLSDLHARQ